MKKSISTLILLVAMSLSASFAGLRDSVLIIEPVLNAETKATYEGIASYFDGRGLTEAADYFRSWAKGGHGSGFAVKLEDGRTVLVTNRHVAAYADKVAVIVDTGTGEARTFADCKVLYTDYLVDIALVEAPAGLEVPVLELGTPEVQDGADVWSAGYPGFMNKPSWQLTKGTVTNRNVVVDDVAPKGENNFLQHSASIDPGNSGGPLMTGDVTKPASLRVVGINTLTATQRNNTYFAVPASKLKAVFGRYAQEQKAALDEATALGKASTAVESFLNAPAWDKFAYLQLFSNSTASEATWLDLQKSARSMSSKDREYWLGSFYIKPVDVLREFASFSTWSMVHKDSASLKVDPATAVLKDGVWTLGASQGTSTWKLEMVREGGRWLVKSFARTGGEDSKIAAKDKKPVAIQGQTGVGGVTPSGGSFMFGPSLGMPGSAGAFPGVSVAGHGSMTIDNGLTMDLSMQLLLNHYTAQELAVRTSTTSYYTSTSNTTMYLSLNYGLGLSYFLMIYDPNGYVAPFIGGRFIFGNNFSMFDHMGGSSGFGKIFDVGVSPRLGIEVSFDRSTAFGIEASMHYYFVGYEGIRSFPVMFYIKQVSIN